MELMRSPRIHRLSFGNRFGKRWGPLIDRDFFMGRDPFDDLRIAPSKPRVNIKELQKYYEMEISLVGYDKSQINVQIDNNVLIISGQKELDKKEVSEYILKEHDVDSFERSFQLTDITNQNNISASFKKGILYIKLYHIEEDSSKAKHKEIPVN